MFRFRSPILGAAITILAMACSDNAPTAPASGAALAAAGRARVTAPGIWADSIVDNTNSGALYGLYMPMHWNGDVIYYAHGFVAPQLPIALPSDDIEPLRNAWGQMGYAVAYSSFAENGYDFADGMDRTHKLREIFKNRYGRSRHAYLVGHSLGGQIVQAIAEEHDNEYSGVLAMCGVLGGTQMETQYIGQLRTVFDFFYPGVLPGNTTQMPAALDVNTQVVGPALAAIQANPNGFGAMTQIAQTQMAGRDANEMVSTLVRVLALHALEANDLLGRTRGHPLFDNSDVRYASATLPSAVVDALNAGVTRYSAAPSAVEWLRRNYQPSGELDIPMVSVHKRFDWLVPFGHEAAYAQVVAEQGRANNLRQHVVEDYGHCEFSPETTMGSFIELVQWVDARGDHR